jgi:serine protease Do
MRIWQMGSATVAVLGAAALAVGWTPGVSGQQAFTVASNLGQDKEIVVEARQPASIIRERLAGLGGGGHLGVSIRDVTPDDVATLKLTGQSGTFVDEVAANSPAASAGVVKGDVVVSFDGENVRSAQQFTRLVRETPPGRTVKMVVTRGGKRIDLTVTPDDARADTFNLLVDDEGIKAEIEREITRARPEIDAPRERRFRTMPPEPMLPPGQRVPPPNTGVFRWYENEPGDRVFAFSTGKGRLGVTVQDLTPELAEFFAVKDGVLVSSVAKDTPAAKAGIKAGDVITAVDGKTVGSSSELVDQLREKNGDVTIAVMRDKKAITLKTTLDDKATPKPKLMRGMPT